MSKSKSRQKHGVARKRARFVLDLRLQIGRSQFPAFKRHKVYILPNSFLASPISIICSYVQVQLQYQIMGKNYFGVEICRFLNIHIPDIIMLQLFRTNRFQPWATQKYFFLVHFGGPITTKCPNLRSLNSDYFTFDFRIQIFYRLLRMIVCGDRRFGCKMFQNSFIEPLLGSMESIYQNRDVYVS